MQHGGRGRGGGERGADDDDAHGGDGASEAAEAPEREGRAEPRGRNADRLGLDLAEESDLTEMPVENGDKEHRRREDLQGNTKLST